MERLDNFEQISPREIARRHEREIRAVVAERYELKEDELELLLDDKESVYLSEKEANTLCSFVLGTENGHMYLVTAELSEEDRGLSNFKVTTIS